MNLSFEHANIFKSHNNKYYLKLSSNEIQLPVNSPKQTKPGSIFTLLIYIIKHIKAGKQVKKKNNNNNIYTYEYSTIIKTAEYYTEV